MFVFGKNLQILLAGPVCIHYNEIITAVAVCNAPRHAAQRVLFYIMDETLSTICMAVFAAFFTAFFVLFDGPLMAEADAATTEPTAMAMPTPRMIFCCFLFIFQAPFMNLQIALQSYFLRSVKK